MKPFVCFFPLFVALALVGCNKTQVEWSPDEKKLVLEVFEANADLHSQLFRSADLPNLDKIRAAGHALATSPDPGLQEVSKEAKLLFGAELESVEIVYEKAAKFSELLAPLIHRSQDLSSYGVFYCPMVDKRWIDKGNAIRNPYAPNMRDCGEKMSN